MSGQLELYREFEIAAEAAGHSLARDNQAWMFDRVDWFRLAARHTLEGEPLVLHSQNENSQCWLFLNQNGASAHALSNWYCLRYGVVREGPKPDYMQLVDGLRKAGVSHIRLDPTGPEDELLACLRSRGWITRREEINVSWRVDTAGMDFETYWAARPSRLRNTAKRKARKAGLECVIHKGVDAAIWADVCEVFAHSWKQPDGLPALTQDLFQQEADAGTLRIGLAYKDGQAVAAQLWTVEQSRAIIHMLAYREDSKQLGAGTILSVEMFRHVLDDEKVDLIDFGIGNDAYKREWMAYSVPLYSLTAYYPFSLSGLSGLAKVAWRKITGQKDTSYQQHFGRPARSD